MSATATRIWMPAARAIFAVGLLAAAYEATARSGQFPPTLLPTLPKIFGMLFAMLADGSMIAHAASTL